MGYEINEIGGVLKAGALQNVLRLRESQTNSVADNMTVSEVMGAINMHYDARRC